MNLSVKTSAPRLQGQGIKMQVQVDYQAKQSAKNVIVKAMQANNPDLVPSNSGFDCVVAAKNIRKELKKAFPAIKFSVRSSSYSGGNSINVDYVDGVARVEVEAIVNKYQYGSFNGMEDIYEYSRDYWNDAFGGTKYLFVNREYSDEFVIGVLNNLKSQYDLFCGEECPTFEDYKTGKMWNSAWNRVFNEALTDASSQVGA